MKRLLLSAAVVVGSVVAGAGAAQAGGWDCHHHRCYNDRCYYPPVRYVAPRVAYYPQVFAPPPYVVAQPGNYVSFSGRNFGVQFGF